MVDWKKLKHAQGPATRVPALIKDLDKPGHAGEAAALQLLEALVVEGRWLPTSAPAAELLVERLTHKGAEPNPMALRLLADLGAGDHLCFVRPDAPARRSKDKQAQATLAIARRAYPRWRQSFRWLFARHGTEPRVIGIYPETFDGLLALDNGVAGSPETVRRFITAEIEANHCNYFVPQMVFGDMTLAESLRSIELFGKEVMPAFAA